VSRGSDGGVAVDATFRALGDAGAKGLFAAGDAACCDARRLDPSTRWFPMRLWSQARVSGTYAARVMCGEADAQAWGFNYELFAHATRFFGVKVILLGLYNAQKLDAEPASDLVSYSRRDDATNTFARVLLLRGVMVGAALLGDTDLEETFENLILNQTDLTRFGPALLDPETDLGDYFD
jgi:NAD(P)H-nitrite reductase large subunit